MTDFIDREGGQTAAEVRTSAERLPRRLGTFSLIVLIVAFNAPIAAMAGFQQLSIGFGNGIGAPVSFLAAGAVLMIFAVGFVRMTPHVPNPGAYYRYIVDGLGKAPGLAGAFLATAAYILITAGPYIYMGIIFLDMTDRLFGAPVGNVEIWTLVAIAVVTVLGLLRVDLSLKVLGVLVLVECVVVALWEVAVAVQGGPEGYSGASWTPTEFLSGAVGLGILFAMLTLIGIEAPACFRDETRNPEKAVPRATFIGIGFLAVFYAIGSWAYIVTQGPSNAVDASLTDPVGSFFDSINTYLGSFFVHVVVIVLVTSQLAALNATQGAASRYLFALGRDRVLPARLARVHPRLESPHVAVLTVSAASLAIVLGIFLTGIDDVQAYAAVTGAAVYFLLPLLIATSVAVIVFFRRHPELSPNVWGTVIAPATSAVALAVLMVLTTLNLEILAVTRTGALVAQVGVVVVAAAGYLLALYYKKAKPETYNKIGNS